jgi:sequestosome 1
MDKVETTLIQTPKLTKVDTMNGEQVSYKVTLLSNQDNETKSEVRRFVVPQDCSTSMVYLKEKLRSIFGRQLENGMKITWRDEDGDDVCIESDEELVIALHEMTGPLYKLAVVACHQEPVKSAPKDHVQETPVGAEIHPGVVCDACEGPVVGHRYKCLKCPDYDLCGKCEAKGFHPGHNMMRIATPETVWPRHFFNRLNKMQTRASKINDAKNEASKNPESNDNEEKTSDNAGRAPGWGRGRGHFRGFRGGCQRGSGSVPPFWMPPAGGNPWGDLMNIGQAVREALDPFGVDVDIEVETPAGKQKVEKAKEATENKTSEAKEEQAKAKDTSEALNEASQHVEKTEKSARNNAESQELDVVNDVAKSLEKMEVQKEPEVIETPKKPEEPAKDAGIDDWTVLENASTASPSPNKSKSATPEPETRGAEAIYPKLDNGSDLSGLSPKIKIALEAMENMGFTNEGGWLSNLLVKYDGDIGKVLDLLAPARA